MTVLVCLDHGSLLVMRTPRNWKLSDLLHYSPVDENGDALDGRRKKKAVELD